MNVNQLKEKAGRLLEELATAEREFSDFENYAGAHPDQVAARQRALASLRSEHYAAAIAYSKARKEAGRPLQRAA